MGNLSNIGSPLNGVLINQKPGDLLNDLVYYLFCSYWSDMNQFNILNHIYGMI